MKECIEHEQITKETTSQDEEFPEDTTSLQTCLSNKVSLADVTGEQQQQKDGKHIQVKNIKKNVRKKRST